VGTLVGKDTQHASEFNRDPNAERKLKYFKSGDPILELVLTLQTELSDPEIEGDKGLRRVFVPYAMQQALQKAVADAGIKRTLPLGSRIKITFTHTSPGQGAIDRKEYSVEVTPPADKLAAPKAEVKSNGLSPELVALMRQQGLAIPGE